MTHPILLFDGVCGLCNRFVQFVLRHDRAAIFRFAALQGDAGAAILARHGVKAGELDTVYVAVDRGSAGGFTGAAGSGEVLLARSDAVVFVLNQMGGMWRVAAFLLRLFPRPLRDAAYDAVGRRRYRLFGRSERCMVPGADERGRFLDGAGG